MRIAHAPSLSQEKNGKTNVFPIIAHAGRFAQVNRGAKGERASSFGVVLRPQDKWGQICSVENMATEARDTPEKRGQARVS